MKLYARNTRNFQISEGNLAWAGIIASVVAYDVWAILRNKETLSGAFDKSLSSRRGTATATLVLWAGLTVHLFDPAIRRALQRKQQ